MPPPDDPYARLSYRRLIAWPERIEREAPFLREVLGAAPVRRLLDLGCGTGEHARFLHAEGFEVVGVDLSDEMLAQARDGEPGPTFVKADLADVEAAVEGTFGGAVCLGNALPQITERGRLEAFFRGLAAHLAAGAPFLLQLLDYARVFERNVRSLPLSFRTDDAGETVVFLRLMEPRPDGTVLFNPTTLRWRPGAEPPVEVTAARNVPLRGWRDPELSSLLASAGLPVEARFGGMRREPYEAGASSDLVLLARRAG